MADWIVGAGEAHTLVSSVIADPGLLDGDTIRVKPGTYVETIGNGGHINITVEAYDPLVRPVFDGNDAWEIAIAPTTGWVLRNLEFTDYLPGISGAVNGGTGWTMEGCYGHDLARFIQGASGQTVRDTIAKDCEYFNIGQGGAPVFTNCISANMSGWYAFKSGSTGATFLGCAVIDLNTGKKGFDIGNMAQPEILNCIVLAKDGHTPDIGISIGPAAFPRHGFNVVVGTYSGVAIGSVVTDHSVLNELVTASLDPLWTDPVALDYRPGQASPLRGLGRSYAALQDDLSGQQRGNGGAANYVDESLNLDHAEDLQWVNCETIGDDLTGSIFSVSLWVNGNDLADTKTLVAFKASGGAEHFRVEDSSAGIKVRVDAGAAEGTPTLLPLRDKMWHLVVVTVSGTTCKVYVDGVLDYTETLSATPVLAASEIFLLGSYQENGSQGGNTARFSHVAVWGAVLVQSDVDELWAYNGDDDNRGAPYDLSVHPQITSQKLWWRCDGDSAPTLADQSGNGNDGNMNGSCELVATTDLYPGVEVGPMEIANLLKLIGVTVTSLRAITAIFNHAPTGGYALPENWSLAPTAAWAPLVPEATVKSLSPLNGAELPMQVSGLVAGADYLALGSDLVDGNGAADDNSEAFSVLASLQSGARAAAQLEDRGLLEVITNAIGQSLQEHAGVVSTRLLEEYSPGETVMVVESTLAWADVGGGSVRGAMFNYTGRTDSSLTGVTFDVPRLKSIPPLVEVHSDSQRTFPT